MIVVNGATDVTTYFVLRDSTSHEPDTGLTVTAIDLYYIEQGGTISSKIDCTALAAANSAHSDGGAFHCGYGVHRIDWPDAAFAGGVGKTVTLIVVCTGADNAYLEVELSPPVNVRHWLGTAAATPTVAGVPEVDVTYVAGAAASGATTPDVNVVSVDATERSALATALLDLANGVETGYTMRQSLRLMAAALVGKVSGYPTGPGVFRNMADSANRISATHDADGNRTVMTLTP